MTILSWENYLKFLENLFSVIPINRGIQRHIYGQLNMYDGVFCENSEWLKAVNYFCKKLHHNA